MKFVDYTIQDCCYTGREGLFRGYDVQTSQPAASSPRIVRTVKPPRQFANETTIFLRDAWESGLYHFPTMWKAPDGIYNKPVIVICAAKALLVVKPHTARQPTKNFDTANYVAIIEDDQGELQSWAFQSRPLATSRVLGVFRRCT